MTKNVGDGCWWRNMLDIFGHSRKQHLMNQKWFLNNILESERKTGFDWFNFDLEIELLTLWIFYLIQSNFIKFTLKNILNTFLHIVTITCVFVGKLWQFLVELFVVSKWRNLWKSLSSSEVVTVFEPNLEATMGLGSLLCNLEVAAALEVAVKSWLKYGDSRDLRCKSLT